MAVKKSELYSLLWEACNKLRGGVEPSRYKDYVLVLLFFKYVSDRYKGRRFAEFTVNPGGSFDDLIAAKGKSDVGERVDKIIQKFLEDNRLQGSLPDVSFNNPDELGSGKELVDKVSGLIAVFQNPAIDFKSNRASGDDIIGDAYELLKLRETNKDRLRPQKSEFTGKILCPFCGKAYKRNTSNGSAGWNCSTYLSQGKAVCHGKKIPEATLKTVCVEVLGTGCYSPTAFDALIECIEVPEDNHLRFIFKDGSVVERTWADRSRRESWTPEMRQAAAERTRSQRRKTQCQE